jgi:O-antigen/teichoic acid export membrane protein
LTILLPEDDKNAMALSILAIICAFGIGLIFEIMTLLFKGPIIQLLVCPSIDRWIYLAPLCIALTGTNITIEYWLNRHKQFRKIVINRVVVSILTASINLVAGFAGLGYSGLIASFFTSQFVSCIILLIWTYRDFIDSMNSMNLKSIVQNAKTYRRFPLLSLPAEAVNTLARQIPTFFLNAYFGAAVVGYYNFSQRLLGLPIGIFSGSIFDVFKQRASSDFARLGNCKDIFNKTSKILTAFSFFPFLFLFLFAPYIFKIVFGAQWLQAGQYTRYLAVLYMARFIVNPLSYVFFITNRQDADFLGQCTLLILSVTSMFIGVHYKSPDLALILFSVTYALIYGWYFAVARILSGGNVNLNLFYILKAKNI